jgi:hypothetical protein
MGWASGSRVACKVIKAVKKVKMTKKAKKAIYKALGSALQEHDWDTQNEVLGIDPVYDEVSKEEGWTADNDDE